MENIEDEYVARIILYKLDFQEARDYLIKAKEVKDKFIRDGLIKIAIVTYAKPFLASTGIHKPIKKFRLNKEDVIPEEYFWLHEMFINYRGNFIGHSNFNTMKPVVPKEPERKGGMVAMVTHTTISYEHWFEIDPDFSDMPLLIDQAINLFTIAANKFLNKDI
ncbi:hypothetical protein [Agaribacter flavus]|uniref:Uncharacterized protein n=1 Tax=Agaribacter flavus TaxID=1902781 RepID=A0ABV7FUZ0_9ALTE